MLRNQKHRTFFLIGLFVLSTLMPSMQAKAQDPITLIIKEGIKKVIKAIDLKIQRLQNKTIWLQNAQKTLENKLSELKLKEISEWSEKQRKQYEVYFNELWEVKNAITYYKRIKEIITKQKDLVTDYQNAFRLLQRDKNFRPEEIDHMYDVYSGILEESVKNLDQIILVINSFSTQMSDQKRLELIDEAADKIEINAADLRQFTNQNIVLSLQRAQTKNDILTIKNYYGIR